MLSCGAGDTPAKVSVVAGSISGSGRMDEADVLPGDVDEYTRVAPWPCAAPPPVYGGSTFGVSLGWAGTLGLVSATAPIPASRLAYASEKISSSPS